MTRIRRTALQRLRIFEAAAGLCHICGGRIDGTRERWDVEHVIPLALGGEDADHNIRPAHVACHRAKSARDAAVLAKSNRVRAKHHGARTARHPLPGSKASAWKRRLDGTVVRRDEPWPPRR